MAKKGFELEEDIIMKINNNKVKDMKGVGGALCKYVFPDINDNDVIKCNKCGPISKADICLVSPMGERQFISIKSGKAHSIHSENIRTFILFLRGLGVSNATQKTILLYQYCDGSLTGKSGKKPSTSFLKTISQDIDKANEELNKEETMTKILTRLIFDGYTSKDEKATFLYFGNENVGLIMNKEKALERAKRNYVRSIQPTLHVGQITLYPKSRNKYKNAYEKDSITANWSYLNEDMFEYGDFI